LIIATPLLVENFDHVVEDIVAEGVPVSQVMFPGFPESGVVPKRYPAEFRRKVLDLVAAGRPVAQVAQFPRFTTSGDNDKERSSP
jgi:hypothetical protein